jgi:hypothetical protein
MRGRELPKERLRWLRVRSATFVDWKKTESIVLAHDEGDESEGDYIIDSPPPSSPEGVMIAYVSAARMRDREAGAAAMEALLHSEVRADPDALVTARQNIRGGQMLVKRMLVWDDASVFVLKEWRNRGDRVVLFAASEDESPRKCYLARDPAAGRAWRISGACITGST